MVVALAQLPTKSIVMDVVVADIPPKFGMLLSRSWESKLKGTLHMVMSYATIPFFGGNRRLYRENRLAHVVNSQYNPKNHPIYVVDTDLGSSIFFNDGPQTDPKIPVQIEFKEDKGFSKRQEALEKKHNKEGLWTMYFYGSISEFGVGHCPVHYFSK